MTRIPPGLHTTALIIELAARRRGAPGQEALIPVPLALPPDQVDLVDAVGELALKVGVAMTSRADIITMLIDMGVAVLLTEMGVPPPERPPVQRREPATVTPLRRRETAGP